MGGGDLVLAEEDVIVQAVAKDLGGEEEASEAESAEVAGVEWVAAEAGEVFGGGVVFPEAAAGGRVPEGEEGGAGEGGEEERGWGGEDPAEVLDAGGRGGAGVEPEEELAVAEVAEGNAALADSEAKVGEGGVGGGVGPAEGGDEWGEGGGGGRHREDGDELRVRRCCWPVVLQSCGSPGQHEVPCLLI